MIVYTEKNFPQDGIEGVTSIAPYPLLLLYKLSKLKKFALVYTLLTSISNIEHTTT